MTKLLKLKLSHTEFLALGRKELLESVAAFDREAEDSSELDDIEKLIVEFAAKARGSK